MSKKIFAALAWVFLSFSILSGTPAVSYAQRTPVAAPAAVSESSLFATADIALLYATHPEMTYYDPTAGLFIKPLKPAGKNEDLPAQIAARRAQFKSAYENSSRELNELVSGIKSLNEEIKTINKRMAHELKPAAEKYDALIDAAADELVKSELLFKKNRELKAIEAKYNIEIGAANAKLSDTIASYDKLYLSLLKIYYLTPEETAKKFETINGEIISAVKAAAEKNGVRAVINYNLFSTEVKKISAAEIGVNEKFARVLEFENIMDNDPDYSKISNAINIFNEDSLKKSDDESITNPAHLEILHGLYKQNYSQFASDLLSSKNLVRKIPKVKEFISQPVIFGGFDITGQAVKELFKINGAVK
ncbi:MAG: hypothetical protein A2008_02910 [Candidatus Wallbacteria bacterium GWC2_49_35]|uniref:DUF5667 domain-containing protein n=1 Tax=Candidatus Wallbacteria bacterium GWC2_49_35 TaxID=1817813 RepID=A0A1F7WN71_9BACT|nr:MAG: hypothetical protein A2008_02910 [Candidatus Wallbacteria bacterium GWC2_49_35]HBC76376.1 hypothetical protein [Candidatus Wallbacteria bacterium]